MILPLARISPVAAPDADPTLNEVTESLFPVGVLPVGPAEPDGP